MDAYSGASDTTENTASLDFDALANLVVPGKF
jgi:hypothetical protein